MALAQKGIFVTVIDFSEEKGKEVVLLIERENTKFHPELKFPSAIFVKCDVTDTSKLSIITFFSIFLVATLKYLMMIVLLLKYKKHQYIAFP